MEFKTFSETSPTSTPSESASSHGPRNERQFRVDIEGNAGIPSTFSQVRTLFKSKIYELLKSFYIKSVNYG